ncbi:MAG TPA: alpha-amylase family glycosyl hydrolase, partial [Thermodesulfovibrionales bacterium]|nr:alpha-amylase family glycosyl hydrolase [Thermodesulfovibrionales bacterium]
MNENTGGTLLRFPVAAYRFQFNHRFKFRDAARLVPYLHNLGITDIYASPYFKARRGSMHGYDIVDPNTLNPEVGTEEEFDAFVNELRGHGMGQILDIVPNHLCTDNENSWWMDVLENGPSSPYAGFFDIGWRSSIGRLANKILIPLLGDQYGKVLEQQELKLIFEGGAFFLTYYQEKFPVLPNSYLAILEHRIADLKETLREDDPDLVEFLSILTAVKHLPLYTETDPDKTAERYREKEIIKKRLFSLYGRS